MKNPNNTKIKDLYKYLISQYSQDEECNKRIILEQIWVLKRLVHNNKDIDNSLKKDIDLFYYKLDKEVFNYIG